MKSKKKLLLNSRLYLILDKDTCPGGDVAGIFRQVSKSGIDMVQLRENTACNREFLRDARIIRRLSRECGIIYIVNNRADIALLSDADGLHLGQSDLTLNDARKLLGRNKIFGISCHNLSETLKAQDEGADYIGIGPVFQTKTKPDSQPLNLSLLKKINRKIKIPYFVIGGIDSSNIRAIISSGAKRFAVCRAICHAKNVKKAASDLKKLIDQNVSN